MDKLNFPKDFIFGSATAAYQVEGAVETDGRGPSVWDEFSHSKGKIRSGENADFACDHYHRYQEDVNIMEDLGLHAYRGSISWSRIFPEGRGRINEKGLDFYDRLTDSLLEKHITPYYTLFHWDLPLALQKELKGFENRETIDHFAHYTETVLGRYGDRVKNWITINEPFEYSALGHLLGVHAPGRKSFGAYFRVMHNLLLAHGRAVDVVRNFGEDMNVGLTTSITPVHPGKDTLRDLRAAEMANQFMNYITLNPLFKGEYPQALWKKARLFTPKILAGDMDLITRKTDFIGINNYQREFASWNPFMPVIGANISGTGHADNGEFVKDGVQHTSMGWEVYPKAIHEAINMVKEVSDNHPMLITENGAAYTDKVIDGRVTDEKRISFLNGYLGQVSRAIGEGANVKGYFVWSFLDNFEWAEGFKKQFGIVHVDHKNGTRTIKDSARWFSKLIKKSAKG